MCRLHAFRHVVPVRNDCRTGAKRYRRAINLAKASTDGAGLLRTRTTWHTVACRIALVRYAYGRIARLPLTRSCSGRTSEALLQNSCGCSGCVLVAAWLDWSGAAFAPSPLSTMTTRNER